MKVVIAKVDEVYFDGEAKSLTAPGAAGTLTILAHHMPLITTLNAGEILVRIDGGKTQTFKIDGGVMEVRSDGATVIL